jgi:hypothetical protein
VLYALALSFVGLSFSPVFAQNPGRVVTLVHQEDWAGFSGAVSSLSLFCTPPEVAALINKMNDFPRRGCNFCQDSFPHEDIVWGTYVCARSLFTFSLSSTEAEARLDPLPCSDSNEFFYKFAFAKSPRDTVGVAITIDPAHATEVRAYLGT